MADFNTSPQLAHATGSVVEREVRQVSNRELQEHKDKIIAWYRHGTLKDLPRLGEERLGIKASIKAYRIALDRWGEKKYVHRGHKMQMLGIMRRCKRRGHPVQFKIYGKPYSVAKLQRSITKEGKVQRLSESSDTELISYFNGNVPIAFEYSDPNNPIADFMAMDGCPRQARIPQSNINTANDDHTVMSQDHTSGTAQSFAPISPVEHVGALSSGPPDASVMASAQLLTIEDPNVARTTPLLFIWQWIDVALNFVEYTTVATDIGNHFARAMDVYRKNFSNGPYDPICMNKYYEKLLEDDQLEEAEEIARLAVEISERWLGPDHVESWKAKGNLAHIYHEQGRYKEARELEANTVEFFNCNETNSDPDALIFKTNLAKTLLALGCMCEAKSVCYDVAEQACQIFGDEHDITLTARFQLAKVCNGLKDFREAREILEKITIARERQQEQHGRLTSKTLRAYIELANTLQQLGHDVEAIEIQRRVEKKLRDSGAIRSMWTLEVVGSVGRLLYSLGEYVGAEHVFRNLVQQSITRTKSERHPKVVLARCWLANSLHYQQKQQESIAINEDCISILSEVLGPENRDTLVCMSNLVWGRESSLPLVDFEARMVKVRNLRKDHLGGNDPDTLASERFCAEIMWTRGKWNESWNALREVRVRLGKLPESQRSYEDWELMKVEANFFVARGQDQEAAAIQEKQMALGESIFGKEHRLAMIALDSLAMSKLRMGHYGDAERLLREGISRLSGSLGSKHPAVTNLRVSYATALFRKKQWASAEMHQRQIVEERRRYGEEHPYFIEATKQLAWSCTKTGKFLEVDSLFKRAIEASKTAFGPIHREVAYLLGDYAWLMRCWGKLREARVLCEKSLDMTRKSFGSLDTGDTQQLALTLEHPVCITELESLACVLERTGEVSSCLILRDQILSLRTQLLGPLHPSTLTATSNLAWTQLELGDTTKALHLYRDCLEKMCGVLGNEHPDSLQVRTELGNILYNLGQFTECKRHYDEVLVAVKARAGENSLEMVQALQEIADLYLNQHKYAQAEEQFQYALRILETIGDSSHTSLYPMIGLADCYRLSTEYGRAEMQIQAAITKAQGFSWHEGPVLFAQSRLAWTYLDAGKFYEAENLAHTLFQRADEEAWADSKNTWEVEEVVARSMAGQGKFHDAITFLRNVIRQRRSQSPKDPVALNLTEVLGDIMQKYREHDYVAILDSFSDSSDSDSSNSDNSDGWSFDGMGELGEEDI